MATLMHSNCSRLQKLPLISVALIEGKAIGGGAELTTACDFRLMTPSAQIGFVHIRLGVTPGWGGGSRLVQLVGANKALDLMLSGRLLQHEEAVQIGLVNDVLTDCDGKSSDAVLSAARGWLEKYTKFSTDAIRAIKGIVTGARFVRSESV